MKLIKLHAHYTGAPCVGDSKSTLKWAVLSHNPMPQMCQVLREHATGMLTAVMSTRAVAREVHFPTISCLQRRFREFGKSRTCMALCGWAVCWCQRCEQSAPCSWCGCDMGTCKLWTTNTVAFYPWQFECAGIPWWDPEAHFMPFICRHHLMFQHDNARRKDL